MNVDIDLVDVWERHLNAHPSNVLHVSKEEISRQLDARIKRAEDEVKRLKNLKEEAMLRSVVD